MLSYRTDEFNWDILPEQLYIPHAEADGSLRLLWAVLGNAIYTLDAGQGSKPGDKDTTGASKYAAYKEARRWVAGSDTNWLYSFSSICHLLGIREKALRQKILNRYPAEPRYVNKIHILNKKRRVVRRQFALLPRKAA